jgi:peptide methionine sulfoxide reductase msrA/msrB
MSVRRHVGTAIVVVSMIAVGLAVLAAGSEQTRSTAGGLLIDDFSPGGGTGLPAARWTVVGTRTNQGTAGKAELMESDGRTCLYVSGAVSPDASGGIEVRRSLIVRRRPLDGRLYAGVRLIARGNGETYAIQLRTRDTRYPKQYYQSQFATTGQWQELRLPFGSFVPFAVTQPLNPMELTSVAVVAADKDREFVAGLHIGEIELYREGNMFRQLTADEERVIIHKGTEPPFTGKYTNHFDKGVYTCRRCGAELFESSSKFRSDCGWPSFDEQIPGAVRQLPDPDGMRIEVLCNHCGGHLGHVFLGERLTEKDTRYCVNSISMDFIPAEQRQARVEPKTERAFFASGCFWGTEYHFQRAPGVISTTVGFMGGRVANATYEQVRTGRTGHAETTEVIYDPSKTSYEQLARLFFETHDFTQSDGQGPDIGTQYRSAIFYLSDEQKQTAERLVQQLRQKGFDVKTEITQAGTFWPAEDYHQDYYSKTEGTPYCHIYREIF